MVRFATRAVLALCLGSAAPAALAAQTTTASEQADACRMIPVTDGRLCVVDSGGTGVPIVLLHATTGSTRLWEKQVGPFRAAGLRVISYDRLGFGRSELGAGASQLDPRRELEELVGALRLGRFHLLGVAAGGGVAIDYTVAHPENVISLVVAHSSLGVDEADSKAMAARRLPPDFTKLPPEFREVGGSFRVTDPEGTARWISLVSRSQTGTPRPPEVHHDLTWAALERLSTPVLLLNGDYDWYAPLAIVRAFASHLRNVRSVVLPEVGHSGYWERPAEFNNAVLTFFGQQR